VPDSRSGGQNVAQGLVLHPDCQSQCRVMKFAFSSRWRISRIHDSSENTFSFGVNLMVVQNLKEEVFHITSKGSQSEWRSLICCSYDFFSSPLGDCTSVNDAGFTDMKTRVIQFFTLYYFVCLNILCIIS